MRRICFAAIWVSLALVPAARADLQGAVAELRNQLNLLGLSNQETALLTIAIDTLEAYANILEPADSNLEVQGIDQGFPLSASLAVRSTANLIESLVTVTGGSLPADKTRFWTETVQILHSIQAKGLEEREAPEPRTPPAPAGNCYVQLWNLGSDYAAAVTKQVTLSAEALGSEDHRNLEGDFEWSIESPCPDIDIEGRIILPGPVTGFYQVTINPDQALGLLQVRQQ